MCGITGFFSYKNKINTEKYYKAHKKIAHRGPDDEGFIYKNNLNEIEHLIGDDSISELSSRNKIYIKEESSLILGHRRLSIIDLSSHGHQPFYYENFYMVYNGEIFNYLELKYELINKGYVFRTNSDTEVFLKAYHCWGIDAFNKFNGMWAAAIYDVDTEELILTRDRFGIKPLFYSFEDDNLIFGSEIKFINSFIKENRINEDLVFSYIRYCHLEHTNETFLKDIFSLEEGSYLIYKKNGVVKKRYFNLKKRENINIEKTLDNSINLRMRSDVEVGALLSGGIDSSTLVCKLKNTGTNNLKTFTADFKEERFSEKNYVSDILKQTKFDGNFIDIKAIDIQKNMENIVYIHETPVRSMSVFLQYKIFEYIKQNTNVKVSLSGQGADEIFSGYTNDYYYYLISLLLEFKLSIFIKEFSLIQNKLNITKLSLFKRCATLYLHEKFSKNNKYGIFRKKFRKKRKVNKFKNYFKNHLYNGLSFSALKEYLRDEDRNSMYFSIESRLPYLDFNIVEEAFSLDTSEYIKEAQTKYTLREIAKNNIPKTILNRTDKMGFISPQEVWQKNELKNDFDKVFLDIKENGLFEFIDNKRVYELYELYQSNNFHDWGLIWRFYCLYYYKKVWNIKG